MRRYLCRLVDKIAEMLLLFQLIKMRLHSGGEPCQEEQDLPIMS